MQPNHHHYSRRDSHHNQSHSPQPKNTVTGKLFTSPRGFGFVITPDEQRIDIPDKAALNTGLHGDTVLVAIHPEKKGEPTTGEVVRVEKRAKKRFVGTVQKNTRVAFLLPDHKKMYTDIFLPLDRLKGAKDGDKVLAEIVKWTDANKNPEGTVLQVIGKKGEHETEMRAAALERGFETSFPEGIEEEASHIKHEVSEEETSKRRDFRNVTTFTIDPADAKDFDDALSYEEKADGNVEIGIHIADVTHYVRPGMKIDEEAFERGTSVYLVDRTIPMLPEVLSNDLCSLRPNEDRLAFSAVFTFSKNSFEAGEKYEMTDAWYGRTIIHSDRRFTYKEAEDVLKSGTGDFPHEIQRLYALSQKLKEERFRNGAVQFETEEIKMQLGPEGVPLAIAKTEHLETHGLIEEYMLLANRMVAKYASDQIQKRGGNLPFIYRVHDEPDPERMEEFITFIGSLGYHLKMKDGAVSSKDLNRVLEESKDTPEESIIHTAAIRTMSKAVYSTVNIGHFGLAFEFYTHFTSPIRRYPDMAVHRLFQEYLTGEHLPKKEDLAKYKNLTEHSSEREQDAAEAERDSVKYKQTEFMQTKVGEIFTGVISGISKSGIFVQEEETLAEGLIRFRDLNDDFYELDEKNYQLVGQNTKKTYRLGDEIKIKLIGVNLERKQIDYALAE
ncbi:MAG TPA: ribonuclease R [Candidatus Paceibacterota bacterium]|nr:ribonuclease R [Candidatus Paceibacterota bacterium]